MKTFEVVAAIIKQEDKILCVQRGNAKYEYLSYKWEFPGGKIEGGETEEEAIQREIMEELGMLISIEDKLMTVQHEYPDFNLTMHIFMCSSADQPVLNEHVDFKWSKSYELSQFYWAAADIPVVKQYIEIC
jgi:8-oxo-dGTP diphosphatase